MKYLGPIFLIVEGLLMAAFSYCDLTGAILTADKLKYTGIVLLVLMAVLYSLQSLRSHKEREKGADSSRKGLEKTKDKWKDVGKAYARPIVLTALVITMAADTFLSLLDTCYTLGTALFCLVETLYLIVLLPLSNEGEKRGLSKAVLGQLAVRAGLFLILIAVVKGMGVLDLLTALSMYSISQLALSAVFCWKKGSCPRIFAVGIDLFLGCDLCVGLRNFPAYFPAFPREAAVAASLLIWLFYLPAQVLIAQSLKTR